MRRATITKVGNLRHAVNFYPRSPCGERLICNVSQHKVVVISIHALLAESDGRVLQDITPAGISIHALLAESDEGQSPEKGPLFISIHALLAESDGALAI